jgi:hypothetical protein
MLNVMELRIIKREKKFQIDITKMRAKCDAVEVYPFADTSEREFSILLNFVNKHEIFPAHLSIAFCI